MVSAASLSTIVALARAGALDHAWREFGAAGFDRRDDDPAALTVKGRLLKDRARRAEGEERRALYLQSADAYQRSAALRPGTYPLINAATLSLLSGDAERAARIAGEVLEHIERAPDEPETPYWRAATEAEALLLLGRTDAARAALDTAVAAAPRAWEDHASTLRQFLLIHDMLGADPAWLDLLRPPRTLHFGAHALPSEGDPAGQVAAILEEEKVGFGYGALAAGADLIVAETLIERGAELHVLLPSDPESFAAAFVDPHGEDWRRRFEAALAAAESVQLVRPLRIAPDREMVALADEIAAGHALLHAARLMGGTLRLGLANQHKSAVGRAAWRERTLDLRGARPVAVADEPAGDSRARVGALLALGVGSAADPGFEQGLAEARGAFDAGTGASIAPFLSGDLIVLGYDGPAEAAAAARAIHRRLRGKLSLRIGGHYGLIECVRDPFSGALRPTGQGAAVATTIAGSIPPDTICVSGDFAAALAAAGGGDGASWIGELQAFDGGSPIGLYALTPSPS
jgi:tetratricopeptide (TPR) repeat protein